MMQWMLICQKRLCYKKAKVGTMLVPQMFMTTYLGQRSLMMFLCMSGFRWPKNVRFQRSSKSSFKQFLTQKMRWMNKKKIGLQMQNQWLQTINKMSNQTQQVIKWILVMILPLKKRRYKKRDFMPFFKTILFTKLIGYNLTRKKAQSFLILLEDLYQEGTEGIESIIVQQCSHYSSLGGLDKTSRLRYIHGMKPF